MAKPVHSMIRVLDEARSLDIPGRPTSQCSRHEPAHDTNPDSDLPHPFARAGFLWGLFSFRPPFKTEKTPAATRPEFLVFERGTLSRIGGLVAFAPGCGIANRTGAALGRCAAAPYRAFHAGLRVGLCSGGARLRIELFVAAARRAALHPALHVAPALRATADLSV